MIVFALENERDFELAEQSVGVSDDSNETTKKLLEIILWDYLDPVSRSDANILEKFNNLKLSWQKDTGHAGFVAEIALHPAYQEIIGMGKPVIPMILNELRKEPHHWFWALSSISGDNPIRPEQRGIMREMINAWLEWGKEKGYIG